MKTTHTGSVVITIPGLATADGSIRSLVEVCETPDAWLVAHASLVDSAQVLYSTFDKTTGALVRHGSKWFLKDATYRLGLDSLKEISR